MSIILEIGNKTNNACSNRPVYYFLLCFQRSDRVGEGSAAQLHYSHPVATGLPARLASSQGLCTLVLLFPLVHAEDSSSFFYDKSQGYISQAPRLEMVNLSDNLIGLEGCIGLIRSVANRGSRGYFRLLYLKTQKPLLTHEQLLKLYETASSLAVGFSADNLNAIEETKSELILNKHSEDGDIKRLRDVFREMVKDNKLVAAGEISYKKTVLF